MRIDILTLFPNMFSPLKESIVLRAVEKNLININIFDIREFSTDKHKKCDDYPFGGGAGMVMTAQPICDCLDAIIDKNSNVFYLSPRGKVLTQSIAIDMAKLEHIILVCGHYEGIDQRVLDIYNIKEISIGDYVLTGGELASMVYVDAIIRNIEGVLSDDSTISESHNDNLLEHNQYTRPAVFKGKEVPDVLLSGNHKLIDDFRLNEKIEITKKNRPDMYEKFLKGE